MENIDSLVQFIASHETYRVHLGRNTYFVERIYVNTEKYVYIHLVKQNGSRELIREDSIIERILDEIDCKDSNKPVEIMR